MVELLQSAYRSHHSTETALLKVKVFPIHAMDNQQVICFIMLDLSAVFDTVLHSLLLNKLKFRFWLDGTIIKWLKSYLTVCAQRVVLHNTQSDPAVLEQGVPHGIVVGSTPIWSLHFPSRGQL